MDDSFENDFELVRKLPSERTFCMILSYTYSYHLALAMFQRMSKQANKVLDKGAHEELDELCYKDPDIIEMFKLIGAVKGLGFRTEKVKYDIEFPTRNHLKVFLAKLIKKRRHMQVKGMYDLS